MLVLTKSNWMQGTVAYSRLMTLSSKTSLSPIFSCRAMSQRLMLRSK